MGLAACGKEIRLVSELNAEFTVNDVVWFVHVSLFACRPGTDIVSQISKGALYKQFKVVCKTYSKDEIVKPTYYSTKMTAESYQKSKVLMCQAFRFGGCGEWVKKPIEQDMFS